MQTTAIAEQEVQVSRRSFDGATSRAGVPPEVRDAVWEQLVATVGPRRLGLPNVVRYLGAAVCLVAMGLFLGTSWSTAGSRVGLALVLTYVVGLTAICEVLARRGQRLSAGLLAASVVALVPLAVFAAQESFGLWSTREFGEYEHFLGYVSSQWVVMEAATLVAAVLVWRRYRTPFLLLPAAVAGWFAAMDVASAAGGQQTGAVVSAGIAAALIGVGVLLDRRALRGEGFWLHLSGLASLSYALCAVDAPAGPRMVLVGLCGLLVLGGGVGLERRVHLVFGGSFVFSALAYLAFEVFGGSPLFALSLGAVGVATVLGAVRLDGYARA